MVSSPRRKERRASIGRRMPPRFKEPDFMSGPKQPRPLTGGYNPESGVRYTDTGVPTAVQGTRKSTSTRSNTRWFVQKEKYLCLEKEDKE